MIETVPPMKDAIAAVTECEARLPLECQRPAVEGGGDSGRGTGYAEGDRTDRTSIHRTVIDRGEEDDRGGGRHQEGDRQQDGDAVDRAQPRHRADEEAERDSDDDQGEIDRLQRDEETVDEMAKNFHDRGRLPAASQ